MNSRWLFQCECYWTQLSLKTCFYTYNKYVIRWRKCITYTEGGRIPPQEGPSLSGGGTHFQRRLVLFPPIFYLRSLRINWFQSFSKEFNYSKYTRKGNTSRADKERNVRFWYCSLYWWYTKQNSKFLFYISICRYLFVWGYMYMQA